MILAHTLASGPDPFGQNLTVNQNPIRFGMIFHNMIRAVCGKTQPSLKVGKWKKAGCVLPETGPDGSCTLTCFRTRCVCPKPDQAIQIGSGSVFHNMIRPDSGCTLAVMATIGRNQNASESDPACLLVFIPIRGNYSVDLHIKTISKETNKKEVITKCKTRQY